MIQSLQRFFQQPRHWLWMYLVLIATAEALITFSSSLLGLGIHALLIIGLTLHGGLGRNVGQRQLALALVLVPLMRVLSLTLPITKLPMLAWYPAIGLPILVSMLLLVRQLQLGRNALGLGWSMPIIQLMLMGGGLGIGAAEYIMLQPSQFVVVFVWNTFALATLLVMLSIGVIEELIFRGLLQALALPAFGRWALVYVSLLFAVMQIGYHSGTVLVWAFAMSLLFAYAVRWSGSTVGVAVAHGLANVTVFLIMPFLQQQTSPQIVLITRSVIAIGTVLAVLAVLILIVQQMRQRRAAPASAASQSSQLNVRMLRRSAGLNYIDLASRTGIPARQLAEIEYGYRLLTPEYRQRISLALNVKF